MFIRNAQLILNHVFKTLTGPRPDWDPDIVAALDDALDLDDPDNILEDDFVLKVGVMYFLVYLSVVKNFFSHSILIRYSCSKMIAVCFSLSV